MRPQPRSRSTHSIKGTVVAASRLWERGNKLSRVLGQRRDTPDNEKWSGRWESNPRLKLGKLGYYHYTTPAPESDSSRLAEELATSAWWPQRAKALWPPLALPVFPRCPLEVKVGGQQVCATNDAREVQAGRGSEIASGAGQRRERRLLVEHVIDDEPNRKCFRHVVGHRRIDEP